MTPAWSPEPPAATPPGSTATTDASAGRAGPRGRPAESTARPTRPSLQGSGLFTIVLLQRTLDEEGIPLGTRGELRFCLARLRRKAGDTGSWREEMARAVEELRERPELAARAKTDLAQPALSGGSLQEDLRWLRRGVDAAARTADPATKVEVRAKQAAILVGVGDPAGWRAVEETPPDGGTLDEHVHRLRGYCNVSVAAMHLGHHGRSESLLATAARIAELHAMPWDPWRASAGLALDWRMGRWDGLEARAHDLIRAASGISLFRGSELVLGSLLATRGQVEEAEHVLAAAVRPPGESRTDVWAVAALAGLRLDGGDAAGAHQLLATPLEAIERRGIWVGLRSWHRSPCARCSQVTSGARHRG